MKLVQLILIVVVTLCSGQLLPDIEIDSGEMPGTITMHLKLKWDALWEEGASLDDVTEEERLEYTNEAIMEISSKMKRKHKNKQMNKYEIMERDNENLLIAYPNLDGSSDS